jgi:hypothetical protein
MKEKFTVMTYCSYPEYEIYRRFSGSLYDTGFTGDVVFFIQPEDEKNLLELQKEYESVLYQVCDDIQYHIHSYRHQLYFDFLKSRPAKDGYVFLCDSKDLLFQRNPEDYLCEKGVDLYFFEEGKLIGECKYNGKWLRVKNKSFFSQVRDKQVLCAGTTLGTVSGITQYLKIMNENILADPRSQKGRVYRDQCIHNFIVYGNQLQDLNLKMLSNDDNFVNTLGYGHKEVNEDNEIVNELGEVSWICHQYNRMSPEQLAQISDRYGFDKFWDAPHSRSRVKHPKHRRWLPHFFSGKY